MVNSALRNYERGSRKKGREPSILSKFCSWIVLRHNLVFPMLNIYNQLKNMFRSYSYDMDVVS